MVDLPVDNVLQRASQHYRKAEPFYRWYAWFKYRMDPCYSAIASHIPPRSLTVDLGTGLGMLPVFLACLGGERNSLGVEYDSAKVLNATRAARGLPGVQIAEGDALTFPIPPCDAITLVDVLHYYPDEVQRDLLKRCAAALRPGGKLLIREGDRKNGGMSGWTRGLEVLAVRLGWNKGAQAAFRPIDDITGDLCAMGLKVVKVTASGRFHPGNMLLVAENAQSREAVTA